MNRAAMKINHVLEEATKHWKYVAPILVYPKNDREYDLLVARLDQLLDIVGDDENHHLMSLIDTVSTIIAAYDEKKFQISPVKGIYAIKYLMELHQLSQADLHDIGSQGVISELLNGKRKLNVRQITLLAKLFHVNPATFIDEI